MSVMSDILSAASIRWILLAIFGMGAHSGAHACAANETRQCIGPACACVFDPSKDRNLRDAANAVGGAIQGTIDYAQRSINDCLARPLQCPESVIKGAPAQVVRPIIVAYQNHLVTQANNRGWRRLPDWFVKEFSGRYPEIDLNSIRYATSVDTIHGSAISLCRYIYFPSGLVLSDRTDRTWMLHELEHSVQCARKGGEDNYLSEYMAHSVGTIASCRCINVHDDIGMERAASAKASDVSSAYGWEFRFNNSCPKEIWLLVYFLAPTDGWTSKSWKFSGLESKFLGGASSKNGVFLWYAKTYDGQSEWSGDSSITHGGTTYAAHKVTISGSPERFDFGANCKR